MRLVGKIIFKKHYKKFNLRLNFFADISLNTFKNDYIYCRDRIRTSINVLGDSIGAGVVEHLSQEDLKSMDKETEKVPPTTSQEDSLSDKMKSLEGYNNSAFQTEPPQKTSQTAL